MDDPTTRTCPWCSAPAAATDTKCPSCGAALAQRDDLGGVLIPGVTGLDPGLAAIRDQPTHIKGPSPSQGIATGIIPAAALGGPAGLAILGGIAAVTAVEYLSAKGPNGETLDHNRVGELGGVAQLALEKEAREKAAAEATTEDTASQAAVAEAGVAQVPPEDHTWDVPPPPESGIA
jgi:hypothetical protein